MPNPSSTWFKRPYWTWVALFFWAAFVFFHYFSRNSAFNLTFLSTAFSAFPQADLEKLAENWLNFLKNLFCASAVSFVLWRLGRKLACWIGLEAGNAALRFCLEMAFGIICANTLWLGLGFNGLWFDSLLWAIFLVLLGWALWDLSRDFLRFQKLPRVSKPGKFFILIGLLGGLGFVLDILQGVTPDVYFDALVYHLSTLQFWKFHHGIADFYTNLYSYYPFGAELYFCNGFFFAGSEAAKLLNAFAAGLLGLAAAGWVAEETGFERGLLAWTMVLTLPLVSATVWTTQNDVVLALFLVLFFYAFYRWIQGSRVSWALVAGLLGGAALTVKYTAVVQVAVGILVGIWAYRRSAMNGTHGWMNRAPTTAPVILGLMMLLICPWLLKNYVFTANPFYPYLFPLFGGKTLPAENMDSLLGDHEAVLTRSYSLGAWAAHVLGRSLDKTIAPLIYGFLPFLFLRGKWQASTRYLLLLSVFLLVSGFLISYQPRLVIPAFILCLIAIPLVLGDLDWKGAAPAWGGFVTLFGVLSLFSLGRLSVDYYQTQKMMLGAERRTEYLASVPQTGSYYALTQAAGNLLPTDACLLVVGDSRGLYYPRSFYANSVFDEQVLPKLAREEMDGAGIRKRLKEMGIEALAISGEEGHRMASQNPLDAITPSEEGKLDDLIQHWTDPLFLNGLEGLYRLRDSAAPPRPLLPDLLKLLD